MTARLNRLKNGFRQVRFDLPPADPKKDGEQNLQPGKSAHGERNPVASIEPFQVGVIKGGAKSLVQLERGGQREVEAEPGQCIVANDSVQYGAKKRPRC